MSKLALPLLVGASSLLLADAVAQAALAQQPSERDAVRALIEKLGGTATLDERRPERPIVAVDI